MIDSTPPSKDGELKKYSSYRDAGVDIEAGNAFVKAIGPLVRSTFRPEVQTDIGGFASLFSLDPHKYKNPLLVSGTDGVGTKLRVAFMAERFDTVGIDLVAMCVNDIVTCGAEPLFFLDYFATGRLENEVAVQVVSGIVEGCKQGGCALIGGETAEMPDSYPAGEFDLAGFAVGVVDRDAVIDGSMIAEGDAVIGVASSGLHSNGYSLVRKVIFDQLAMNVDDQLPEFRGTVADELLRPTRIYAKTLQNLQKTFALKGIVHITGGGLLENIPRILPKTSKVVLHEGSWDRPAIFDFLQREAGIADDEMHRVFNNGLGLVIVVPEAQCEEIIARLEGLGESAWRVGRVERRRETDPSVEIAAS